MLLQAKTIEAQQKLADFCRTGNLDDIPGIKKENVHHYRRLVYNVINNTLIQAFPITCQVLETEEWNTLVDEFFKNHDSQTPQVWKLPLEFFEYVKDNGYAEQLGKAYLNDLLYFEWLEIEVHTMPDIPYSTYQSIGNILVDYVVVNPEFKLVQLQYPVHLFGVNELKQNKGRYYLIVYREPETDKVKFMNLSPLHAYVFSLLAEGKINLYEIMALAVDAFHLKDKEALKNAILKFANEMFKQKLILGFQ